MGWPSGRSGSRAFWADRKVREDYDAGRVLGVMKSTKEGLCGWTSN